MLWFGLIVASYLLGSVSWSYLIVRLAKGIDVRSVGSGNAGATNVLRAAGKGAALGALVLDVGKGVAAVGGARLAGAPPLVLGAAGLAVVLGHVFPVFLKFRGGKGVATAAGALGALAPTPMLLSALVFVVLVSWKRYVSLGSMAAAAAFPLLVYLCVRLGWIAPQALPWPFLSSLAIAVVIVVKHWQNLRRLWAGTEPRLGQRSVSEAGS